MNRAALRTILRHFNTGFKFHRLGSFRFTALGNHALAAGTIWMRHEARFFRSRWDALMDDAKARGLVQ